jgi:hypothetical protein
MNKTTKLIAVGAAVASLLAGCGESGLGNQYDEDRGRGDAGVGAVNDCDRTVLQSPDNYANVAVAYVYEIPSEDTTKDCAPGSGACNGLYMTTRKDQTLQMHVVPNDPTCPGREAG